MRRNLLQNFVMCFLILYKVSSAQTYTCTVQNQTVNGSDFSFDIYMQRTDATEIYLGQSEFSLEFNNGNFNSPAISFEPGSPDLDWYAYDAVIPIGYPNVVKFSVGALTFGTQTQFNSRVCKPSTVAPGTLIATVTISGIQNFGGFADMQWRTTAPHDSKVNTYVPITPWNLTNITVNGTYTDPVSAPLPVELTSFTSKILNDKVQLNWSTKTETNNFGFDVERCALSAESQVWEKVGFVNGNGNSNSPKEYTYTDKNLIGGSKFLYRLKQVDNDGQFEYSDAVEVEVIPNKFELSQNYPNPFNPATKIRYQLPNESKVVIKIYNILGSEVMELVNEQKQAGIYEVEFNAESLASGTYIYKISADNFVQTKKMILLK
jgi:hypothetical protein